MANTAFGTSTLTFDALRDRFSRRLDVARENRRRRELFNRTFNELSALSNRDLADLGIARSEIRSVAREAAYGK